MKRSEINMALKELEAMCRDITDFGQGNFDKLCFSLITIRSNCRTNEEKHPKVYAEKLLYLKEGPQQSRQM